MANSTSVQGRQQPATEGKGYGSQVFTETEDPALVLNAGEETGSVLIRAHGDNNGTIYIGWDDEVSADNGFPLENNDSISLGIDNQEQPIWAVADTANDEVRYLASN